MNWLDLILVIVVAELAAKDAANKYSQGGEPCADQADLEAHERTHTDDYH